MLADKVDDVAFYQRKGGEGGREGGRKGNGTFQLLDETG